MAEYARPETLVSTQWAADHLNDPKVRLVEVDVDTAAYDTGHIPGAVGWNWKQDLETSIERNIASREEIEELCARSGISNDTTLVFYGDNNNWFATYALWLLRYYGHEDGRIMNGGRKKWIDEGRPTTTDAPKHPRAQYKAKSPDPSVRAVRDLVAEAIQRQKVGLVDVRSPREFSGEILAPENLPQEGSQRGGHIPGAKNIVWSQAVNEDGTFKTADELKQLYQGQGISPYKEIIAYCRIGERSSHTWFVLSQLLGYPNVRNYDGSWTEWGSCVGLPIERP
ncbi:MAG: sulfurtransferase [Chloroflexi bacterium]|nr:sulfurtransferase [Chloroflexota bacterium]